MADFLQALQKRRESIEAGDQLFKAFDFEAKANKPDGSEFEGLVSVFYNVDSYGEIVDDGAFDEDLPAFMQTGFIGGLNHDWNNPIGKPLPGTKVLGNGLFLRGSVLDTTHGMDVRKLLLGGVVKKLSIGYRTLGYKVLETVDDVLAYWESKKYSPSAQDLGRAANGNIWVLTRLRLYEGSPVTVPANDAADITAVKARAARAIADCFGEACGCQTADHSAPNTPAITDPDSDTPANVRELERFLRDAGLPSEKAKAAISLAKSVLLRDAKDDHAGNTAATSDQPAAVTTPESETPEGDAPQQAADTDDAAPTLNVTPEQIPDVPKRYTPSEHMPSDLWAQEQRLAATLESEFLKMSGRFAALAGATTQ